MCERGPGGRFVFFLVESFICLRKTNGRPNNNNNNMQHQPSVRLLSPEQIAVVNRLHQRYPDDLKICVRVPRRGGKTTMSQILCANPSLLGKAWSELDRVVRLDGRQSCNLVRGAGIIVDNADMLGSASLRRLAGGENRILLFHTQNLHASMPDGFQFYDARRFL